MLDASLTKPFRFVHFVSVCSKKSIVRTLFVNAVVNCMKGQPDRKSHKTVANFVVRIMAIL